jgi:predicted Zn-dependent peptidase
LRDKLGLTYGIGSAFSYSKELGTFSISSATRNETVGQLITHTIEVLRELKKGPIGADEVGMAKEYLEGGFPLGTATLGAVASRWLSGFIFDLGPDYLNEFTPKVRAVTAEQVTAAILRNFDIDGLVIAVAGDSQAILKSLNEAKIKPVLPVNIKQLM